MAEYECCIEQGEDWISVRGGAEQCPFRIDLVAGYVMLDAGEDSSFVLESTVSSPGELNALVDVLRRLRDGQDVGEGATAGSGRLIGGRPYTRKTDDPALDSSAAGDGAHARPLEPSAMDLAIRDVAERGRRRVPRRGGSAQRRVPAVVRSSRARCGDVGTRHRRPVAGVAAGRRAPGPARPEQGRAASTV
jgi:hypothetical protein